MELNFDKEMDALLRQTAKTGAFESVNGSNSGAHIDADAISAFAENALPDKTRSLYMSHLADCDRCRKILSNLIALNAAEPWPPAKSAVDIREIAIAPTPWYQKLFAFPNLAYTMGALVILFGGMIGFLVFQNINNGEVAISQANTYDASKPAFPQASEPARNASVANSTGNANSAAGPGMGNFQGQADTNTVSAPFGELEKDSAKGKPEGFAKEEQPGTAGVTAPATPDVDPNTTRDDGIRTPINRPATETLSEQEKKSEDAKLSMAKSAPAPPPPPPGAAAQQPAKPAKKVGRYDAEPKDAGADRDKNDSSGSARRQVGGKTFNRSGGVWYDSSYSQQRTTDVRRGTDEYRKLDSGLRSIADNLGGTVIVVWKQKAYRIQ